MSQILSTSLSAKSTYNGSVNTRLLICNATGVKFGSYFP